MASVAPSRSSSRLAFERAWKELSLKHEGPRRSAAGLFLLYRRLSKLHPGFHHHQWRSYGQHALLRSVSIPQRLQLLPDGLRQRHGLDLAADDRAHDRVDL